MVVDSSSPDKDFKVDVAVAGEKDSFALRHPELQQWQLNEYPEDKLRAGTKNEMDRMRDFGVTDDIIASSVTDDQLHGTLDTAWVNRWKGLEVQTLCQMMLPAGRGLGLVLRFDFSPLVPDASHRGLGLFCFDITTAFLHAFLNPDDPMISGAWSLLCDCPV